jgi:hypothetical protein
MTKQYQIQEYINRNVWKSNNIWICIDLRYGDSFEFESKKEAVQTFISIWDLLTPNQKNRA